MEILISDQNPLQEILIVCTHYRLLAALSVLLLIAIYISRRSRPVYLLDFTCFKGRANTRVPISAFLEHSEVMDTFHKDTIVFQRKVAERSGIGNETFLPPCIHEIPPDHSFNSGMGEIETVVSYVVEKLLSKQRINPRSIDILITNCSLACPVPSLSAMVINKFGLRSNVLCFNLSGMGCSAGLLSVSLAKDLLKVHKNSLALVLSTESVSTNVYRGKVKSMVLANCLFRLGGAGILLSNKKQDKKHAKYELQHVVRTNLAAKLDAYNCVRQDQDDEGYSGVILSRTIVQVAGEALKSNLLSLGSLVLPYSEQIRYASHLALRRIWPSARKRGKEYSPGFNRALDHFCIHAGGRTVIDGIKEKLRLSESDVEASKMTLYRWGNTSSSSPWYSLSYLEAKERVKKGDRVWQLSFGSGFKCNSAVWKCVSKAKRDGFNAWDDRIDLYPVEVPDVIDY